MYLKQTTSQKIYPKSHTKPCIAPAVVCTSTLGRAAVPCPASGFYPRDASVSDALQSLRVDFTERKNRAERHHNTTLNRSPM